jgi:hypothetical protein
LKKELFMSTTSDRTLAKKRVNMAAFVDNIREVNEKAKGIAYYQPLLIKKSGKLYARQELADVLGELEETVKVLRGVVVGAGSASGRTQARQADKPAARPDGAHAALSTEALIKKKQLVTALEFQHLMGWTTRQAVWKAEKCHRVFYLSYGAERYFPAFYGDPTYDRKKLEDVTKVLGDLPGGSKLQFFLTRKGSLGGDTPLQALAAGRFAKVKDLAAAFAEVPSKA